MIRWIFSIVILLNCCLLALFENSGYAQSPEEWYEAGAMAFEGMHPEESVGGVKRDIRTVEERLNKILKAEMLEKIFLKREEFSLDEFFGELLSNHYTGEGAEETLDALRSSYLRIGQRLSKNVLTSLDKATMNMNYTDAHLKKAEVYLTMHLEQKAIDEFKKARDIFKKARDMKFEGMTMPVAKRNDFSEKEEDRYKPMSLRELIYSIAALYVQGKIRPESETTEPTESPTDTSTQNRGTDAADALIADLIQFKADRIDLDTALSEDEKEEQQILDSFELVKFYLFMGQHDRARAEYDRAFSDIRDEINLYPRYVQGEISRLQSQIPHTTRLFLAFRVETVPLHIRLIPAQTTQNIVDYLAIVYEETGITVRLAHEIRTIADSKQYGFPLEQGRYVCLIDIPEVKIEATNKPPVEIRFNRGPISENIIYQQSENTNPQMIFTQLDADNPKTTTITPADFDENKFIQDKKLPRALHRMRFRCNLDLQAQTSYNFGIEPYIVKELPIKVFIVLGIHAAAVIASAFSF